MKIGVFTDPHYSSAKVTCQRRYNSLSLEKMQKALRCFLENGCEMVICLGDLVDHEADHEKVRANLESAARLFRESGLRVICLRGNHDADCMQADEFYAVLGEECRPQPVKLENGHLLFLDACFSQNGERYQPGHIDWTDTFYPEAEALQKTLQALSGNVYLFLHQNIDPSVREDHRLSNADQMFDLILNAGNVRAVYQGHYHPGKLSEYGGVRFATFPAMCENESAWFVIDGEEIHSF